MANFLVTGGAGFIGSHIVKELISRGESVKVIDNLETGKILNIKNLLDKIEFYNLDIRDLNAIDKLVEDIDYILHQAAIPSVQRSIVDPYKTNSVNVNGTLNILILASKYKVKRVVLASSSSVYGNVNILPKKENLYPRPLSPYAVSKLATEYYAKVFYEIYGLETVILRYFNVFGPKQDPNSQYAAVIPKFIKKMLNDEKPEIYGDGEQSRDFTYVENIVNANILAVYSNKVGHGEIINIACGNRITLNQLVESINEILGKNIKPIYREPRPGDVKHSQASIKKAIDLLDYQVKTPFYEGLIKTIEWFKNNV